MKSVTKKVENLKIFKSVPDTFSPENIFYVVSGNLNKSLSQISSIALLNPENFLFPKFWWKEEKFSINSKSKIALSIQNTQKPSGYCQISETGCYPTYLQFSGSGYEKRFSFPSSQIFPFPSLPPPKKNIKGKQKRGRSL